jgi:LPS-assembly lipoprotein
MSLFKRSILIILICFLSSCGFKPMYQKTGKGGVYDRLATVEVQPLTGDVGRKLYVALEGKFSLGSEGGKKMYSLGLALKKESSDLAIQKDGHATRRNVKLTITYELRKKEGNSIVDSGSFCTESAYDMISSEFANYTAEQYSFNNSVREATEELFSRISIALLD